MRRAHYDLYVSLGDSMSIDYYAGPGLGAASLLYRNNSELYPEFDGADLSTANPDCSFLPLARDGATIARVEDSLRGLQACDGRVLVTITVGGNDLIAAGSRGFPDRWLAEFESDLGRLFERVRSSYPEATLLAGNIYDVSDGTGRLQSRQEVFPDLLAVLPEVNSTIFRRIESVAGRGVDIYRHFLGHGLRHDDPVYKHYDDADPSCWICLDIEPTRRGSSEIRRLFWEAL